MMSGPVGVWLNQTFGEQRLYTPNSRHQCGSFDSTLAGPYRRIRAHYQQRKPGSPKYASLPMHLKRERCSVFHI